MRGDLISDNLTIENSEINKDYKSLLKELNKKIEKIYRDFQIPYSKKDLLYLNMNNLEIEDKINQIKNFLNNFLRKNKLQNKSKDKILGEFFSDFEENSNKLLQKYISNKRDKEINSLKKNNKEKECLIKEYDSKIKNKIQEIQNYNNKIKNINKINIILGIILLILIIFYPKIKEFYY